MEGYFLKGSKINADFSRYGAFKNKIYPANLLIKILLALFCFEIRRGLFAFPLRTNLTYSKVLSCKILSEKRLREKFSAEHLECIKGVDKETRDNTGVFAYAKLSEQS